MVFRRVSNWEVCTKKFHLLAHLPLMIFFFSPCYLGKEESERLEKELRFNKPELGCCALRGAVEVTRSDTWGPGSSGVLP